MFLSYNDSLRSLSLIEGARSGLGINELSVCVRISQSIYSSMNFIVSLESPSSRSYSYILSSKFRLLQAKISTYKVR